VDLGTIGPFPARTIADRDKRDRFHRLYI